MTHQYMDEEVVPEAAEPTVAMMTGGCDCPSCRTGNAVTVAGYPQTIRQSAAVYAPSSRTVSYRKAVPANQRVR